MVSGERLTPTTDDYQCRLWWSLVSDILHNVETELLEAKSIRFLANYPWKPGKRFRPVTFLLAYLSIMVEKVAQPLVNGRESRLAAAIELMHEASLVHDDLVDRSLLRRGKPTMHAVNGDGLALLIGDYMVFRGLKLVLDAAQSREDIVLAQELANTGLAIAHGEVDQLDTYLNKRDVEQRMSMQTYLGIIGKKTAAFFAGCAEGGAALAGANRVTREVYRNFGMNMGLVFQMIDDLMDIVGDPKRAMKNLRSNIREGTVTLPMIHAWTLYPGNEGLLQLAAAKKVPRAAAADLERLLASDEIVARSKATMDEYAAKALDDLARMPANIYRAGLADLLDYVRGCPWGGLQRALARSPRRDGGT